jgi:hypothetical protein
MTGYVADAHAHFQKLVLVVKIVAMYEYTTEEQHSVPRFLWAKGLSANDIHK